eukprot:Platyproteum_vivax@DN3740_c0_g1_i2.p1
MPAMGPRISQMAPLSSLVSWMMSVPDPMEYGQLCLKIYQSTTCQGDRVSYQGGIRCVHHDSCYPTGWTFSNAQRSYEFITKKEEVAVVVEDPPEVRTLLWVTVGLGIAGAILVVGIIIWFFVRRKNMREMPQPPQDSNKGNLSSKQDLTKAKPAKDTVGKETVESNSEGHLEKRLQNLIK